MLHSILVRSFTASHISPAYTTATRERNVDNSAFSSEYSSQNERLNNTIHTTITTDAHLVEDATDDSPRRYDMVSYLLLRTEVGDGGLLRIGMVLDRLFFHLG